MILLPRSSLRREMSLHNHLHSFCHKRKVKSLFRRKANYVGEGVETGENKHCMAFTKRARRSHGFISYSVVGLKEIT